MKFIIILEPEDRSVGIETAGYTSVEFDNDNNMQSEPWTSEEVEDMRSLLAKFYNVRLKDIRTQNEIDFEIEEEVRFERETS